MNDFYLTLPSNTEPENKTGNFSVLLPTKLQLRGKWEVALVEIQYPYSWNNISSNPKLDKMKWIDKVLHYRDGMDSENWLDVTFENGFMAKVFVPPGHYGNIRELLTAIEYGKEQTSLEIENTLKTTEMPKKYTLLPIHIDHIKYGFSLHFEQTIKRVICKFWDNKVKHIGLSPSLRYMLGFEQLDIIGERNIAKYHPDIRVGFYSLFIYCSLVEPQIVGNVTAPLLRSVHIHGTYGDIVEKLYQTPHYVPVMAKDIDRIEIDIKDDNNQSVPFQFGKTVVKLHFRKKRSLLL